MFNQAGGPPMMPGGAPGMVPPGLPNGAPFPPFPPGPRPPARTSMSGIPGPPFSTALVPPPPPGPGDKHECGDWMKQCIPDCPDKGTAANLRS
ncbi:hypothetical protein DUNSADRAFT_13473 [Dunaliella salina]|uniref:Uncharacterized protein n=1 Tax=Dunaliella salina TaxID=3046 RepID=A0ABQ7G9A6_DUNSA|nr:hypothetical protein DUNSADRAFT_13473 [Dunaliella salina]|eukprot:KAF5831196.1 hypothetical protein DUNSADRAFT_13473 [Dunaliella salina]